MLNIVNINVLAVLLAAVAYMILGAFWYSPALFGKQWMKLIGLSKNGMKKDNVSSLYLVSFITGLIMAFVLSQFIQLAHAVTYFEAMRIALWSWIGFIAPFGLTGTMFQSKPPQLFLIDSGYYLVSLLLMAIVLFKLG